MLINFTQIAFELMSKLGYAGMMAGLVLDSFGIPIPSEVLLTIGGALAARGRFEWWIVFLMGVLAQCVGGLIGYAIGRYGGIPILEKYGKYVLISRRDVRKTHEAFEKYGIWMTMVGRCVPVVRGLIAYPAGIAQMRLSTFVIFTALGSAIWTAAFVYAGYVLGTNLGVITVYLHQFSLVVMVLLVAGLVWHFRHHLARLRRPRAIQERPEE